MGDDNTVLVGGKPPMNYVTAVVTQFTQKNFDEVFVKSRGKYINRAVDISLLVVGTFLTNTYIKEVKISNDDYEKEGKTIKVSAIKIVVAKNAEATTEQN